MNTSNCQLLVVTGPTASGKTRRAVELARALDCEIISADSRQVYRGMDIGTGKDLEEYGDTPYHLIDVAPAGSKYNLFRFLADYEVANREILSRGRLPLMCGGTGMYLEAVLNGIRLPQVPENKELRGELRGKTLDELKEILAQMKRLHNDTDVDSPQRAIRAIEIQRFYAEHPLAAVDTTPHPVKNAVIIGIDIDRESRRSRISDRLRQRLDSGMIDEVKKLLDNGIKPDDLIYYGLEYKFVTLYLTGALSKEQMTRDLEIAIHQFAKRQMTWFRGMERRGFKINWFKWDMPSDEFIGAATALVNR